MNDPARASALRASDRSEDGSRPQQLRTPRPLHPTCAFTARLFDTFGFFIDGFSSQEEIRPVSEIDPTAFEYAISKIADGFIFEKFAQDLLCQILGLDFVPIGGIKDKGIDGLEHTSAIHNDVKTIYQISIEKDPEAKIRRTLEALSKNGISIDRLFYVTNRLVPNQDQLEEAIYKDTKITVRCRDAAWLRGNINKNEGTVRTYLTFIESHLHEFARPGNSLVAADFTSDPRVFVFLRQQWEEYGYQLKLDDLLTDSLILLALEGTDPDQGKFLARDQIIERIAKLVSFSPKTIETRIDQRLKELSSKAQHRVNHHTQIDQYCLPYKTRLKLEEKNLADRSLHEKFLEEAEARLRNNLASNHVIVRDALKLLESTFNTVFKQQGLEFAAFVTKAQNSDAVEKSLPDIIAEVVDGSSVIPPNRTIVKVALLATIREIIYKGSDVERLFLRRLSHSYMMLFLLQCDPHVCRYFDSMASKLKVFVCTSILVPALSEYPLLSKHRRHWNLLINAHRAGVKLIINRVIVSELVAHLRKALGEFSVQYAGHEDIYCDQTMVRYIPEILTRSYFYARISSGSKASFSSFIDNFVTPNGTQELMEREIIEWLNATFGIQYAEDTALGVSVDQQDLHKLTAELKKHKASDTQAGNDARTILTVYALRQKNNETASTGIFGYQTWWLSKDTTTQKAVNRCLHKKSPTSCYIRPDFLWNYISLAPSHADATRVFDEMFPTLMGVTLSQYVPEEISDIVNEAIREHAEKNPARVKSILSNMADRLKSDLKTANTKQLKHWLDEEFSK